MVAQEEKSPEVNRIHPLGIMHVYTGRWGHQNQTTTSLVGKRERTAAVVDSFTQSWYDVPCSYSYPRICQMDAKLLK
ncbi:hypothetical protein GBF38_014062 [Nibea albiflora]|uniref:Uncharacterized protein n=1 Tax=Nibea albiflora TaxID=240163 RepID=A0ACB7F6X4_NIBAL|nr:hypothetical protein GBF38_014062 [Nibea albiflora]